MTQAVAATPLVASQVDTQPKITGFLKRGMPLVSSRPSKLAAIGASAPSRVPQVIAPTTNALSRGGGMGSLVASPTSQSVEAGSSQGVTGTPVQSAHAAVQSQAAQASAAPSPTVGLGGRKEPYRCQMCAYFLKQDRLKKLCSQSCPTVSAGHTKTQMEKELNSKLRGTGRSANKLGWKELMLL